MMSLWDALRMNMMISYQELVRTFPNEAGKVIYKTITRDVVKYVQSPNRTVCRFDDAAVQLRQRAIDAANSIPGFDESAVQSK
ncbi:hypothetical protein ACR912_20750, partial [Klebsiella pneumoniae]